MNASLPELTNEPKTSYSDIDLFLDSVFSESKEDPHKNEHYASIYGGAARLASTTDHETILHGPYETGKTFAILTHLHWLMNEHPHARGLMVRETYKSLITSAAATYENKVLPLPIDHPDSKVSKFGGEKPDFYEYRNGSRIYLGGLDNPGKFLSAEFDYIYVNQAEETALDSWEKLVGRATGRAGNTPNPRVFGDCNPDGPGHWILSRASSGTLKLYQQMHEHNPVLFNQETGEITEQGKLTLRALDNLTGIRYQRGRLGLWVAAEGVIYDNFSLEHNVTEDAEYNPNWDVIWGVDDGYAHGAGAGTEGYHPRVVLLGQITPVGGIHIFDEYYKTGELSEVTIANVLARGYKKPELGYIDSSASELRARLYGNHFIQTIGATHTVSEGIKNVRRLICDGQEVRLLKIHPRCQNLIRELQSYRYDPNSVSVQVGEPKPMKLDDHGCFIAGTMIRTLTGDKPIETVSTDDYVLTRKGYRRVLAAGMTADNATVYTVHLSNGNTLTGTGNHPVYANGTQYIPLKNLQVGDRIEPIENYEGIYQWSNTIQWLKKSFSMGLNSGVIPIQKIGQTADIIAQARITLSAVLERYTAKSGSLFTVTFQRVMRYITETITRLTMILIIWRVYLSQTITNITQHNIQSGKKNGCESPFVKPRYTRLTGTKAQRVGSGIGYTASLLTLNASLLKNSVSFVEKRFSPKTQELKRAFVLITAKCGIDTSRAQIMKLASANGVGVLLPVTSIRLLNSVASHVLALEMRLFGFCRMKAVPALGNILANDGRMFHTSNIPANSAVKHSSQKPLTGIFVSAPESARPPITVVAIKANSVSQPVFNLTVNAVSEYFANGVLVHNCDSLRYMTFHLRYT